MTTTTPTELFLNVGDNRALRSWRLLSRNPVTGALTAVDLTTASAVEIHAPGMANPTMSCTFLADATGTVSRMFVTADLVNDGDFPFETQVTWADTTVQTFPNPGTDLIHVRPQLG